MTTTMRPQPPAVNGDEERFRLLAIVQADGVIPQLSKDVEDTEMTWPHLVVWEFIASAVFVVILLAISWIVNAPLVEHANPSITPNPAKAPWYFLNLQELLLHMHPTLAGVLVPGIALTLLAMVPFFDSSTEGVGRYFGSAKGMSIAVFASVYTAVLNVALILFDEFIGVRRIMTPLGLPKEVIEMVVPSTVMVGLTIGLVGMVRIIWKPVTTRQMMIALFFGFVSTFLILTIIGTAFRGAGMHLVWPWQLSHGE